jgi:Protein of unknown function (DUF2867)
MAPQPRTVPLSARSTLPGSDYADAFALLIPGNVSALDVAQAMVTRPPAWINALMSMRNGIVAPFGLKAGTRDQQAGLAKIGIFPVISASASRVVAGMDDRHLDFRIVIDVERHAGAQTYAMVTTLIRRHNWLGRVYLGLVLPFHKLIVPAMLGRAVNAT